MGNCCRRESATVWASLDEWEEMAAEKEGVEVEGEDSTATGPLQQEQVKIKITKRELEGLIASARVHDVPVDRLLSRFIKAVAVDHHHHHHSLVQRLPSWSPILHTIPE